MAEHLKSKLAPVDRLGIDLTACQCLNILQMKGAISAGQLAELMGLTTGAITGVIDRAEVRYLE